MARSSCVLVLALAAFLATAARVDGVTAAPAPAPSAECSDMVLSLAGCLSYVQDGSTVTKPDPSCCSGLKDVVRKQVACLCQVFKSGQDLGLQINMTKALQLPAACKVKTPPFSKCNVSLPGAPGASPVPAPSPGAPFFGKSPSSPTPSGSPAAAATGSASTPSSTPAPSPARSGAASLSAPAQTFVTAAAVAATLLVYRAL